MFDRHHGRDVDVAADAEKEDQTVAKGYEISEQTANDEQARGSENERHGPALFTLVKSWRYKGPNLIEDPRRADEDRQSRGSLI